MKLQPLLEGRGLKNMGALFCPFFKLTWPCAVLQLYAWSFYEKLSHSLLTCSAYFTFPFLSSVFFSSGDKCFLSGAFMFVRVSRWPLWFRAGGHREGWDGVVRGGGVGLLSFGFLLRTEWSEGGGGGGGMEEVFTVGCVRWLQEVCE